MPMGNSLNKAPGPESPPDDPSALRVRLSINTAQPCFRHMKGKSDREVRAWAEMACNYMATYLDAVGASSQMGMPATAGVRSHQPKTIKTAKQETFPGPSDYLSSFGKKWKKS